MDRETPAAVPSPRWSVRRVRDALAAALADAVLPLWVRDPDALQKKFPWWIPPKQETVSIEESVGFAGEAKLDGESVNSETRVAQAYTASSITATKSASAKIASTIAAAQRRRA